MVAVVVHRQHAAAGWRNSPIGTCKSRGLHLKQNVQKTSKQVFNKVEEEVGELKEALENNVGIEDELGDVLFSIVNLTRHLNINPETSLKKSIDKFSCRFKNLEKELKNRNKNIQEFSLVQLDALWESIKLKEK